MTDMTEDEIKNPKVAYHRNGIGGEGFHVVLFDWKDEARKMRHMMAVLYEGAGQCSVFDVDMLKKKNIGFARGNSWRGDHFEAVLREVIKDWTKAEDKRLGIVG